MNTLNVISWNICWGCMTGSEASKYDTTSYELSYKICAKRGQNTSCKDNITNYFPLFDLSDILVKEGETKRVDIELKDKDLEDVLGLITNNLPSFGKLSKKSDRVYELVLKPDYDVGNKTFETEFILNDGKKTYSKTITITVDNVNRAPTASNVDLSPDNLVIGINNLSLNYGYSDPDRDAERGTEIRCNVESINSKPVNKISNSIFVAKSHIFFIRGTMAQNKIDAFVDSQTIYLDTWSEINDLDKKGEIKPETVIKYSLLDKKSSVDYTKVGQANPKFIRTEYTKGVLKSLENIKKEGLRWNAIKKDIPVFVEDFSLSVILSAWAYASHQYIMEDWIFGYSYSCTPYTSHQAHVFLTAGNTEKYSGTTTDTILMHEYGHNYLYCDIYNEPTYKKQNKSRPFGCVNDFYPHIFDTLEGKKVWWEGTHYKDLNTPVGPEYPFEFVSVYGGFSITELREKKYYRVYDKPRSNVCPLRSVEYGEC